LPLPMFWPFCCVFKTSRLNYMFSIGWAFPWFSLRFTPLILFQNHFFISQFVYLIPRCPKSDLAKHKIPKFFNAGRKTPDIFLASFFLLKIILIMSCQNFVFHHITGSHQSILRPFRKLFSLHFSSWPAWQTNKHSVVHNCWMKKKLYRWDLMLGIRIKL